MPTHRPRHPGPIALAALAALAGCAADPTQTARVVAREPGVVTVAMPAGDPSWRPRADRLLAREFPRGYRIVREQEVATPDAQTAVRRGLFGFRDSSETTQRREYQISASPLGAAAR